MRWASLREGEVEVGSVRFRASHLVEKIICRESRSHLSESQYSYSDLLGHVMVGRSIFPSYGECLWCCRGYLFSPCRRRMSLNVTQQQSEFRFRESHLSAPEQLVVLIMILRMHYRLMNR